MRHLLFLKIALSLICFKNFHLLNQSFVLELYKQHLKPSRQLLIHFLVDLLNDPNYEKFISWRNRERRIFRIEDSAGLAKLWGRVKGIENMDYPKLSRSLRYYYKQNLIEKVKFGGLNMCYRWGSFKGATKWELKCTCFRFTCDVSASRDAKSKITYWYCLLLYCGIKCF